MGQKLTNSREKSKLPQTEKLAAKTGKLTIVPTPIGNLSDITLRANEALAESDVVFAEDTRVTGKLLSALKISKPRERLDEQVLSMRAQAVIDRVVAGENVAYCTDAGMPSVSDPGARLISLARQAGIEVEVLPGASAVTLAYVASGTSNTKFYFGGFFPRKEAQGKKLLESLATLDAALIFYESPKRLVSALNIIAQCFPYRELAVCRELTKLHEEVFRAPAPEVADEFSRRANEQAIKGEIVILIDGPSPEEGEVAQINARKAANAAACEMATMNLSAKDIARTLVKDFGISRNDAYEIAVNAANLR